jgi:UDP-N-acetylglucosamine 4,6-dehydratase/5-epimerase
MNILITGAGGFLSRYLLKYIDKNKYEKIICLIYSEKRYIENIFLFENCIIYKGDISDENYIKEIFENNKIDYIIHTAALKYINTCELFQRNCIDTNMIGTLNLCKYAKKYKVKNLLTISTDKSNNPSSLYGISKLASEYITLSHGFSVYQGVNFWNSDGSFLQKWKTAMRNKKEVILYDEKYIRHFAMPDDIAKEILEFVLINNNKIYYPEKCYEIKLVDIFNIFKELFPDRKFIIRYNKNKFEKYIEDINEKIKVLYLSEDELKNKVKSILQFTV